MCAKAGGVKARNNVSRETSGLCGAGVSRESPMRVFHVSHLPMQNWEKMTSSRSSTSTAPEILPMRSEASRRSSARNS